MDLIIFTGFHKNGFSSNAENEGDFDCDSDDGEVDHDAEMNELVSFENKVLDFIDPKVPRFTILKGVEAVAWLKKRFEGNKNIQENVGHDKLTKRSLHVPTGTFTSSMGSISMKVTVMKMTVTLKVKVIVMKMTVTTIAWTVPHHSMMP